MSIGSVKLTGNDSKNCCKSAVNQEKYDKLWTVSKQLLQVQVCRPICTGRYAFSAHFRRKRVYEGPGANTDTYECTSAYGSTLTEPAGASEGKREREGRTSLSRNGRKLTRFTFSHTTVGTSWKSPRETPELVLLKFTDKKSFPERC